MTKYKSGEKNGSKLLIPAATLLLCVVALIGAGYAASVSSVAVNNNDVKTDVLVLTLTNSGDHISEGEFSIDGTRLNMGTRTVMTDDGPKTSYYVNKFSPTVFGQATLKIDATGSTATKVALTCDQDALNEAIPYGMKAVLKVAIGEDEKIIPETGSSVELLITSDNNNEFVVKLYLSLENEEYELVDDDLDSDKPKAITYPVKLSATPTTP